MHILCLSLLAFLASPLRAISPHSHHTKREEFPIFEPGPDIPPPDATVGYFMNHVGINVRNLTRSIEWYRDVLGFQVLFSFRSSPRETAVYLGHSTTPHPIPDGEPWYQTPLELIDAFNSGRARGLLELIHYDYEGENEELLEDGWPASERPKIWRFSHLGVIVPNVTDAQVRFESLGVNILKKAGELPDLAGPIGAAYGLIWDIIKNNQEEVNLIAGPFFNLLLILDPDGNLVEVQSLTPPGTS